MPKKYRQAYFPGTEELAPDEMRVIALGTGMPLLRPSQMSAGWFVELGNGDKFFFDMGTGCIKNFAALDIAYQDANKLFLSHLHSDHVGDYPLWWIGGWITRQSPVYVWGPSGKTPELGTKHCIEKFAEAYTWDITSRIGELPEEGRKYVVNEFDYKGKNEIVYQENGVIFRSWSQTICLGHKFKKKSNTVLYLPWLIAQEVPKSIGFESFFQLVPLIGNSQLLVCGFLLFRTGPAKEKSSY